MRRHHFNFTAFSDFFYFYFSQAEFWKYFEVLASVWFTLGKMTDFEDFESLIQLKLETIIDIEPVVVCLTAVFIVFIFFSKTSMWEKFNVFSELLV